MHTHAYKMYIHAYTNMCICAYTRYTQNVYMHAYTNTRPRAIMTKTKKSMSTK